MKKFYKEIVEAQEIQQKLERMNFTKEEAAAELANIEKLEDLNVKRSLAKAHSENFTEKKDKAFAKLKDWMSNFYAAARLALKKEAELLEVLYKSA